MYYLLVAEVAKKAPVTTINPWILVSIAEFLIIVILTILLFKKKQKKPDEFYVGESIKGYKDAEVDLGNMFNSMFNASILHDALKKKIHPDRFPNDVEKIAIANELTTQLNENKNNIAKMKEIQTIASEKLGIKF
jgi:hypothetical protein